MARDLVDIHTNCPDVDHERELLDEVIANLTRVRASLGEADMDG